MVPQSRIFGLLLTCALSIQIVAGNSAAFNAQNTAICFDLHDVVVETHVFQRVELAAKNIPLGVRLAYNKLINKGLILVDTAKNKTESLLIREWATACKVNPGVLEIIKELKSKGYTVNMASNITNDGLDDLMNPELLQDDVTNTIHAEVRDTLGLFEALIHVDTTKRPIIQKPNPAYFEMVKVTCGAHKKIVFIDDNKTNVESAHKCGLTAIPFKSAEQLRQDLQALGIL